MSMINSREAFKQVVSRIKMKDASEIETIAYSLLEYFGHLSKAEILAGKPIDLEEKNIAEAIQRINEKEPLQYILGETFFYNRKFFVNRSVLIPRPETEELVHAIIQSSPRPSSRIVDIGTGSGCIAITLALAFPTVEIVGIDISADALAVARKNAKYHQVENVTFIQTDFLQSGFPISNIDIVVSNPPYVPLAQKNAMIPNVLDYEPHEALFVSDEDPLVFYKALISQKSHFTEDTNIWVEINDQFGPDVVSLFREQGYINPTILKDINQKDRFVVASYKLPKKNQDFY